MRNRLQELRKERGLAQNDVAEKLKIAASTLSQWETGIREMDYETLFRLADFYKVSIDYMLGRSDEFDRVQVSGTPLADVLLNSDETDLVEKYQKLAPKEKERAKGYIEALLDKHAESSRPQ